MSHNANVPAINKVATVELVTGVGRLVEEYVREWGLLTQAQWMVVGRSLELGRRLYELSGSAEVQAQVALLNKKENNPQGGRPRAAHCVVAEGMAEYAKAKGVLKGLTALYAERCYRAFVKAKRKGLDSNMSITVVEQMDVIKKYTDFPDVMPSPERLFKSESETGENGTDGENGESNTQAFDPERDAIAVAKRVQSYFVARGGYAQLRTKKQQQKFCEVLNMSFEHFEIGLVVSVTGKE
jgi:hypothetical protein